MVAVSVRSVPVSGCGSRKAQIGDARNCRSEGHYTEISQNPPLGTVAADCPNPILFVTLDITDETRRRQARYMADNLGISAVYDDPFESGMVKLIDRQGGEVLAVLTGEEHRPKMEGALAQTLSPRP